jgi:hypothetical protein
MCGPGRGRRSARSAAGVEVDAARGDGLGIGRPSQHQQRPGCRSRPRSGRGPRPGYWPGRSARWWCRWPPMPRPVPWWSAGTNAWCHPPLVLRACPRQAGTLPHFRHAAYGVIRAIASQPHSSEIPAEVSLRLIGTRSRRTATWTWDPRPLPCEKQARPSRGQRRCWECACDLGVCCRCMSAAAAWLQGVRRLFAACWSGSFVCS